MKKRQDAAGAKDYSTSELYQELSSYQEQGVELWLNGRRSTSYQIASSVCEKTNYMRDYYMDHQNHICGIGFDRIRKSQTKTAEDPFVQET